MLFYKTILQYINSCTRIKIIYKFIINDECADKRTGVDRYRQSRETNTAMTRRFWGRLR